MTAWRADNPVAPPPMIQISMLSSLTVASLRELAWQSPGVMRMGRAQSGRQGWRRRKRPAARPRTEANVDFIHVDPIRVDPSRKEMYGTEADGRTSVVQREGGREVADHGTPSRSDNVLPSF